MAVIICQRSGIPFEGSARMKQHPKISAWLQEAHKEGWYTFCVEAIAAGKEAAITDIEEFEPLIASARQSGIQRNEANMQQWQQQVAAFKKEKKERHQVNQMLKKHEFYWRKVDVLDSAQGETGEFVWELYHESQYIGSGDQAIAKALKMIEQNEQNEKM